MGRETYLVDANIFLEMLLEQDRREECILFFERARINKWEIIMTTYTLYAIGLGLERKGTYGRYLKFLDHCQDNGFCLAKTDFGDEIEISHIVEDNKLDFDDAHQYWAAKKLNARLVSFDTDFDRADINRLEPKDILAPN